MDVYILSNGVHTDIVVPLESTVIDWRPVFKLENTTGKDSLAKWVALGWGDKGFYLDTPTWSDLKFSTAFNALFGLSTTAIHSTFYRELKEGEKCKKIRISLAQYRRLVGFIKETLTKGSDGEFLSVKTPVHYGKNDAFYEANGRYSMFYTCNSWTNEALKRAGQKASLFTLFDAGIFCHYQ